MRLLTCLLIALCCEIAQAGNEGVLIERVPRAEKPLIIASIKQAFVGRKWTIDSADENSVTASLHHRQMRARMRIAIVGGSLVYEESSTQLRNPSRAPSAAFSQTDQPIALTRWLENIRLDVKTALAGIPEQLSESLADRLKALDELRGSGIISEDEYKAKRAEILADL